MRCLPSFTALLLLMLTGACTRVAFTVANLPTHFDDVTIIHDVTYGPEVWQKLDLYIPAAKVNSVIKKSDVVVFFYGGRWTDGTKNDYRFVGTAFAQAGFITAIPDYSKYPAVRFPVFVEDGAKALAWVSDNIASYKGDPQHIHVVGHSSGAHIGALLAADPHYLAAEGKKVSDVIYDFSGLAGPYAFTPDEPDLKDIFGPPSHYAAMQVPTFIDGKEPPMLLLYGDADKAVGRFNLERLVARIHEKGGCVKSIIYPDVDHTKIVGAFSWIIKSPVMDDVVTFMRTQPKSCDLVGAR